MISIFRHRRRREEEDIDALFRASYPTLYRHAYALLGNEEDSRDIISEVFVKLLDRGRGVGDASRGRGVRGVYSDTTDTTDTTITAGYLMAMVHNRAIDLLRQRKVEDEARRQMMLDYRTFIAVDEGREERLREIQRFVESSLTPQTQRILRMCYDEKKTYREVAQELGISIQAVNKHISQALRKLRERFKGRHA